MKSKPKHDYVVTATSENIAYSEGRKMTRWSIVFIVALMLISCINL